MISTSLFPYESFDIRLQFGERKNITVCYFECDEHLQKYLNRHKLDKKTIKIDYRDGEPVKSSQTNKNNVQSGTGKTSNGSTNRNRRGTKSVDTNGNTRGTRKSKSK
jgi:hypothetical protein